MGFTLSVMPVLTALRIPGNPSILHAFLNAQYLPTGQFYHLSPHALNEEMGNVHLNPILPISLLLGFNPFLEELVQRLSKADEVVVGHREAAGRADLVDVH